MINRIQLEDVIFVDDEYSLKPPHMIHRHKNFLELQEHRIQTYCLVFSGVQLENLPAGHMVAQNHRPILSLGKENFVANLLPDIYKMFHAKKNFYEACRHLAVGIFFMLREKISEHDENLTPTKQKREHLTYRIMDYINEHYAEPLTLKKISEAVYISEAQSKLIEAAQPIQDIGEELGFVSSAHFSKMFKKYVGITPKEYRSHFLSRREGK